jgi:Type II secretion system (T2SS), protein M subtype b
VKISIREKRFLAVGGGVIFLTIFFFIADNLIPTGATVSRDLDHKKKLLLKYREILGQEAAFKARLEECRQRLRDAEARLLPGDNPSIVGAELQKTLIEIAAKNQVEIMRKNIQKEQKVQDNLIKISVRVDVNCQPEQLVQFLAEIGNYDKHLTVDELMITSYRIQKKIEIRPAITVSGYIRGSEAPPADKIASVK